MNFENYLKERQQRINTFLLQTLPVPHSAPTHLHQAMHYTVLNGGKRIRPLLVYATGEAFGLDLPLLDAPACAIELIHAYSLVHDDLPAMDNDDLRRGKPTCHKAFDEATAILVGDALQALAFEVLTRSVSIQSSTIQLKMVNCLAKAAGSLGMAGGQSLDLKATGKALSLEELETIHQLKTGALISASIQLGALAANIDDHLVDHLQSFGKYIGLCFQIQDDILDAEGSTFVLGKTAQRDAANHKATFTTLSGLETAKHTLAALYQKAINALEPLGEKVCSLTSLAEYMVMRKN